jgi:hypothetical protein
MPAPFVMGALVVGGGIAAWELFRRKALGPDIENQTNNNADTINAAPVGASTTQQLVKQGALIAAVGGLTYVALKAGKG